MTTDETQIQPNENRLVLYSSPGTLQEYACVVASASIWYRQLMKSRRSLRSYTWLFLKHLDRSEFSHLPLALQGMVEECVRVVQRSFIHWGEFHIKNVFSNRTDNGLNYDFVEFICWQANGTVDYTQTARNLIKSDALTGVEKYEFACLYCLVDDIDKLWPTTSDLNHQLVQYWNSRKSGEQCSVQVDQGSSCVEATLLKRGRADTQSACEYLWNFLTDEERVQKVIDVGNWSTEKSFLKYALCRLNENQLERVMSSSAYDIFCRFYGESEAMVVQLWNHVKNMISNDAFRRIIAWLDIEPTIKVPSLIYDLWIGAPNSLKNHVLVNHFETVLSFSMRDAELFIELLSTENAKSRQTIWRNNWFRIIRKVPTKYLPKIMKLCLDSDNEVVSFKKTHLSNYSKIDMYSYGREMVFARQFNEMSEFFHFASDDPEAIFNLRLNVLQSRYLLEAYVESVFRTPEMVSLEIFLKETFPDRDQLNVFKTKLILSDKSLTYFKTGMKNDGNFLVGVQRFVDFLLHSTPDLAVAKSKLLELSYDVLVSGDFTADHGWRSRNSFIKWCLDDDDEAVENFKQSLPVDQIFSALIAKCESKVKQSRRDISFGAWDGMAKLETIFPTLNWFPEWVFTTKQAVQNFKLSRLHGYEDIQHLRSVLESNNASMIDMFLRWFFNNDRSRVENFKISFYRVKLRKRRHTKDDANSAKKAKK